MKFELITITSVFLLAVMVPRARSFNSRGGGSLISKLARRRWLAIASVGALAFLLSMSFTLIRGTFPIPCIHDEFAYLLSADTFTQGRLTNPTHPMWEHFESFHIMHQPSYQAKYPPAQALALALGQSIWHPALGVWISFGLAIAATCWMLYGWLPPRWAFVGAVLACLNIRIVSSWGDGYWGGAIAMTGGALVYGALPRLLKQPRIIHSLILGIGLGLLANSRPYEGLVASLPAAVALLIACVKGIRAGEWAAWTGKIIVPTLGVLLAIGCLMAVYNLKVTGNASKLPYIAWQEIYRPRLIQSMILQQGEMAEPSRELTFPEGSQFAHDYSLSATQKILFHWFFFLGPLLTIPLIAGLRFAQLWRYRVAFAVCVLVWTAVLLQSTVGNPHYCAPAIPLLFLFVAVGMRRLGHCGTKLLPVRFFAPKVVLGLSVVLAIYAFIQLPARQATPGPWSTPPYAKYKQDITNKLNADDEQHLIVVRYSPGHIINDEWVYNGADLENGKVLWARELTAEKNQQLVEHYSNRRVWLLDADARPPRMTRYKTTNDPDVGNQKS